MAQNAHNQTNQQYNNVNSSNHPHSQPLQASQQPQTQSYGQGGPNQHAGHPPQSVDTTQGQGPPPQGPPPLPQGQEPPQGQGQPPQVQEPLQPPQGQGPPQGQAQMGQQQPATTKTISNPCCCDIELAESVAWITGIEVTWGLIYLIVTGYYLGKSAENHVSNSEAEWIKYGRDNKIALYGSLSIHLVEVISAIILMVACGKRVRSLCFLWLFTAALASIGAIVVVILNPVWLAIGAVVIIPFRFYFAVVIWALSSEIALYPLGPPARTVLYNEAQTPIYTSGTYSPVIYAQPYNYGGYRPYYGGYGGYGYGYPYGYGYGGGSAALGFALGASMYGGGYHSCDYGFYDDCYW